MNQKSLIWIGMIIGSSLGGIVPTLWGSDFLSFSSLIFTALGGIIGIWITYKISID